VTTLVSIPYAPRKYQVAIHDAPERFQVVVAHRRAGKTVGFVNHLIRASLTHPHRAAQFAYAAPTYKMAKRIAWDYVKRYSAPVPGMRYNASELTAFFPNGGKLMLLGADRIHDLRGIYLMGCVLDEYAQMSPRVFPEVVLPALMDHRGWAILGGTPLGANALKRAYVNARNGAANWRAHMLRASETGAIPPEELAIARANMSEAEYAQEWECSFEAAIRGAYYGELMAQADAQGRIRDVPYDPALSTTVAVDLGMRDAFACVFLQEHPAANQVRVFDYVEFTGKGLKDVYAALMERGYRIDHWVGPHDLAVRELGTGRSRIEVARELGMHFAVAANLPFGDGIEAVRVVLPTMVFDAKRCEFLIDALRQYRADYDDAKDIADKAPVHDWTSHGADAVRYYAVTRPRYRLSDWAAPAGGVKQPATGRRLRRG
jgi:hypothetical protein